MLRRGEVTRIGAGLLLAAMLAGCSDIYYDRRDTVTFAAGDAVVVSADRRCDHAGDPVATVTVTEAAP